MAGARPEVAIIRRSVAEARLWQGICILSQYSTRPLSTLLSKTEEKRYRNKNCWSYMDRKEESTEVSGFDNTACPLAIRLLGSFDARIAGRPLPRLRSRKGQELLALLALRPGRAADRSWLAGVLWAESGESQALANLRLCLTDLRKALGTEASRLHAPTPRALSLDLAGAWADVLAFDPAILKGDTASLEAATALYRGALLEACEEEWLLPERLERAEAYLGALETLSKKAIAAGHPAHALPFLKMAIAIDPLRASVQRALMQALADTGDRAAVTQVYRDFRLYLHEELHAQPDQETTVLYEGLRGDRKKAPTTIPPMRTAPAPALPSSMTPLIGREAEVAAVCACLARTRLVTLTGPGGTGKTRLAIAVAQQLRETFAEQVWFVSLAELPNVKRLVEVVRDGLGLPRDQPDPHMQLVRRLSAGPSLLILDNYEHLVEEGARFVEELLADIPSLVCLVTSRRALNLVGETLYRVPALGFLADVESTLHLLEFSGVRLYVERAAARRAGFHLTLENGWASGMSTSLGRLISLMATPENEHLEFKEAKSSFHFEKLVKYCAALANEGGGVVVLGVTDKPPRRVVGSQAFMDIERTEAGIAERLHLRAEIDIVSHPDGRVLVVQVPPRPLGVPVQYEGAYWMRGGEDLVPMTPDMLKRIFEEGVPDFKHTDAYQVALALRGEIQDALFLKFLEEVNRKRLGTFTVDDYLLLDCAHWDKPIPETLKSRVPGLVEKGVIEAVGSGRYILSRSLYAFIGKTGVYTRKRGLDRETNKQLLLKHIVDNAGDGSRLDELMQVLPAMTRSQVQLMLRELRSQDSIHSRGTTRAARWYPSTFSSKEG